MRVKCEPLHLERLLSVIVTPEGRDRPSRALPVTVSPGWILGLAEVDRTMVAFSKKLQVDTPLAGRCGAGLVILGAGLEILEAGLGILVAGLGVLGAGSGAVNGFHPPCGFGADGADGFSGFGRDTTAGITTAGFSVGRVAGRGGAFLGSSSSSLDSEEVSLSVEQPPSGSISLA